MINPALLKALIPQEVMNNVQNAATAFIEMRKEIAELKMMVSFLYDKQLCRPAYSNGGGNSALPFKELGGLSPDNGGGKD